MSAIRNSIVLSPDAEICGQCHSQGAEPGGRPYPTTYSPGQALLADDVFALVPPDDTAYWWITGHARAPNMQFNEWWAEDHSHALTTVQASEDAADACLECHSADYRWANAWPEAPESVTVETAQYGVTCASCHTVHGTVEVEEEDGTVSTGSPDFLLTQDTYTLCVDCHRDTDATDGIHHAQQEMYEGLEVVAEVAGIPSAHFAAGVESPECVTCHFPRVPTGTDTRGSHTFQLVLPGQALAVEELQDHCSSCHGTVVDVAGLQALIDDVQTNTAERLDAARAALTADSPAWVRRALDFVAGDGSLGIHNYVYADAVLDAVELELGLVSE